MLLILYVVWSNPTQVNKYMNIKISLNSCQYLILLYNIYIYLGEVALDSAKIRYHIMA